MLEKATEKAQHCCVFTVVPNLFMALECTEHTHFSAILVATKDTDNMSTSDFQQILRRVGAKTPIVRVLDKFECIPEYVFDEAEDQPPMRVLFKPFTDRQLCDAISSVLQSSQKEEGNPLYLQSGKHIGFHNLDCFDSSLSALDDQVIPFFLTPTKQSSTKAEEEQRNIEKLLASIVSEREVKRRRSSSSSASSSLMDRQSNELSGGKDSSSSSNSVSTDFDPDTVFQDEA